MRASDNAVARPAGSMWLAVGLFVGGLLVMTGAVSPWLTLYAGLQRYPGTTGTYGWLAFGAGALSVVVGGVAFGRRRVGAGRLAAWCASLIGASSLAFTAWLFVGLVDVVARPESAMLVPRPGYGLFLISLGAMLVLAAGLGEIALRWKVP